MCTTQHSNRFHELRPARVHEADLVLVCAGIAGDAVVEERFKAECRYVEVVPSRLVGIVLNLMANARGRASVSRTRRK